jgi:dimethylglycine dehydrogenase
LLARLTNADLSNAAFPFFRSQRITVAGVEVVAIRVSFTGDLGWELHCAEADQVTLYEALLEAGRAVGAGPVGSRALMSLRLEKGYGSWGRDYSPEYWPQESGLDGLIRRDKDFLNKDSWLKIEAQCAARRDGAAWRSTPTTADASGSEPIFLPDGTPVGQVSSGAMGIRWASRWRWPISRPGASRRAIRCMWRSWAGRTRRGDWRRRRSTQRACG